MKLRGAMRVLDFILSVFVLFLLSPVFLFICAILKLTGEGEIFYIQRRIGKGGQEIGLIKFATMIKSSVDEGSGELTLPGDYRVLPVGKVLRSSKLNELPQLVNIIKGDMSLIGPRPQTPQYFACFSHVQASEIVKVTPGLSGVSSIFFRDEERLFEGIDDPQAFDRKVIMPFKGELETWYVKNKGFWLDLYLFFLTIAVVIFPTYEPAWLRTKLPAFPPPVDELLRRRVYR